MTTSIGSADNYPVRLPFFASAKPSGNSFIDKMMKDLVGQYVFVVLLMTLVGALTACVPSAPAGTVQPAIKDIILATTTSTQDSGLLDVLIPVFEKKSGYVVKVIAVGSGQALKMGEQGNADVLLVHAPTSEKEFMKEGFGEARWLVMHNDFVIVGPADDPAGLKGIATAVEALQKIAATEAVFVSRGDDSGTHKIELDLWKKAAITPTTSWYQESGQGMAATLKIASEKSAYTLSDRATYLANQDTLGLVLLFEGDPALLNVYHVIVVNSERWPEMNLAGAKAFVQFLLSPETQQMIAQFGVDQYGQPLFIADGGKTDADLGLE